VADPPQDSAGKMADLVAMFYGDRGNDYLTPLKGDIVCCFVYVIQSVFTRRVYVGITNDVARRLKEHNIGKCPTTQRSKPWVILKVEEYSNYVLARRREKYLKSGNGRNTIKNWTMF
jgi:putative endonuclease